MAGKSTDNTREKAESLYEELRKVDAKAWKVLDAATVGKDTAAALGPDMEKAFSNKQSAHCLGSLIKLAARISKKVTKDEFCAFFENGEVPPIRLTSAEMSVMQGGLSTFWKVAIPVLAVGGAVAAYKFGMGRGNAAGNAAGQAAGFSAGRSEGYAAGNAAGLAANNSGAFQQGVASGRTEALDYARGVYGSAAREAGFQFGVETENMGNFRRMFNERANAFMNAFPLK